MPKRTFNREVLGNRVRDARELAGLTQADLAAFSGVTTETISRLERGLFDPAISTLIAVADALDLDLDYMVGRWERSEEIPQSVTTLKLMRATEALEPDAQRALLKMLERLLDNDHGPDQP